MGVFSRRELIDGRTLSVFDVTFPGRELRDLAPLPIRFDQYHASEGWPFWVRPSTFPETRVVRVNDRVQYASHVVNMVVPVYVE